MNDPFEAFRKWKNMNPLSKDLRPNNKGKSKPNNKKNKKPADRSEYKNNLFKKLKHRSKYVNMEYDDTKEIFEKARKKCVKSIMNFCKENPNRMSPLTQQENKDKKVSKKKKKIFDSEEVKSVFRQIVLQTHPDKFQQESDEIAEEMTELYLAATEAKENCDFHVLMDVATDLRIDADELSMEQLEFLEKEIESKEQKILDMRKDIMWHWYHANNKTRQSIIENLCPKKKGNKD